MIAALIARSGVGVFSFTEKIRTETREHELYWGEDMGKRLIAGFAAGLAVLACSGPAKAQIQTVTPTGYEAPDSRGVDPLSLQYIHSTTEVAIGDPAAGGLVHGRTWFHTGWRDTLSGVINSAGSVYSVTLGDLTETFTYASGAFTSDQRMGSTLSYSSSTGLYTYTARDGSVGIFDEDLATVSGVTNFWAANTAVIVEWEQPQGEIITYTYNSATAGGHTGIRPQSVSTNTGYQIHFTYANNSPTSSAEIIGDYLIRTKATGINRSHYNCANDANTCSDSSGANWPYVAYGSESGSVQTVTDRLSNVTRYVFSGILMTGIRAPTSPSANTISIGYGSGGVENVSIGGKTWSYEFDLSLEAFVVSTHDGRLEVAYKPAPEFPTRIGLATYFAHYEGWEHDAYGRVIRSESSGGTYVEYEYDSRGNILTMTRGAGSEPEIVTTATYPATCSEPLTCNRPTNTTDALGFTTDYVYLVAGGSYAGPSSITVPAPSGSAPYGSGARPQIRFSYGDAGTGVIRVTSSSTCSTGSSCADAANETVTQHLYDSQRQGSASWTRAGDWSLYSPVDVTYTPQGDIATMDGPLSGTADTTRFYYDDMRRLVATVSPDPDGGGSLQHRVARTTYDADGQPTTIEQGFVSAPSSWASMTVLNKQTMEYTSAGQLSQTTVWAPAQVFEDTSSSGGFYRFAIHQAGYDNELRRNCSVLRMNPAEFDATQQGACALDTAGDFGFDRIHATGYDPDSGDRVFEFSGAQTAAELKVLGRAYAADGSLVSVEDGNGGLTSYEYDAFKRLEKTRFPDPGASGASSSTDFDQTTYDDDGLVETVRVRDTGGTYEFAPSYDNLGRVTAINAPGSDPDISYAYDNFGRVTEASQSGHTITYVYDALSNLVSETNVTGVSRTVSYLYDEAGRRIRMTWPDGFYVVYDYNVAGELIAIRENGATSGAGVLATFTYDNAGRRTAVARGNGSSSSYGYDAASRLSVLDHAIASDTSKDFTAGFDYNPAGQIVEKTAPSAYDYASGTFSDTYAVNYLNQLTSLNGSTALTHDSHGNTTHDGTRSYAYDYRNRMVSAGSATLSYDPANRLYQVAGGSTTRFLYDGADLIAEYDTSGNLLRRYVHGPGLDEPLVWFEGAGHSVSGTPDRRHLFADERGSVVTVEGSSTSIYKYDPYGQPGSSQTGRFQYTGQTWIGDAGLYYYKARFYNPDLGRFMQPDPIGYEGGMNLYAYVGGDPVNLRDPFGLIEEPGDIYLVFPNHCWGTGPHEEIDPFTGELVTTDGVCVPNRTDAKNCRVFGPVLLCDPEPESKRYDVQLLPKPTIAPPIPLPRPLPKVAPLPKTTPNPAPRPLPNPVPRPLPKALEDKYKQCIAASGSRKKWDAFCGSLAEEDKRLAAQCYSERGSSVVGKQNWCYEKFSWDRIVEVSGRR